MVLMQAEVPLPRDARNQRRRLRKRARVDANVALVPVEAVHGAESGVRLVKQSDATFPGVPAKVQFSERGSLLELL